MRATFTSLAFLASALIANAQLTLTPKAGLESTRTSINYNDVQSLSPLGAAINPQIGLRLDYKFKKSQGPYLAIATNRSITVMQFSNPENGITNYTAFAGKRQVRFEGGYEFSSKPVSLGSRAGKSKGFGRTANSYLHLESAGKYGCARHQQKSSCGSRYKGQHKSMAKHNGFTMRIHYSAGMAYNPSGTANLVQDNSANYFYNAGNWKTAITGGTEVEFARGRDRIITVGFQYLKGLGNSNASITTQTGTKANTTYLSSRSSAFNITLGVPFTLSKQHKPRRTGREINKFKEKKPCTYYRPCRRA